MTTDNPRREAGQDSRCGPRAEEPRFRRAVDRGPRHRAPHAHGACIGEPCTVGPCVGAGHVQSAGALVRGPSYARRPPLSPPLHVPESRSGRRFGLFACFRLSTSAQGRRRHPASWAHHPPRRRMGVTVGEHPALTRGDVHPARVRPPRQRLIKEQAAGGWQRRRWRILTPGQRPHQVAGQTNRSTRVMSPRRRKRRRAGHGLGAQARPTPGLGRTRADVQGP